MKKFKYLQIVLFAIGLITSSYVQAQCEFTTSPEQTACSGEEVMFEATSEGGTFEWFDGPNSIGSGPTISVSPTLTTSYTVVHTDGSCKDTNIVTVNVLPVTSVTTNINHATCGNGNGDITVIASGGLSPYTYSFDGGTPSANNTYGNLYAGTYTINVSDGNGCIVTDFATINDSPPLSVSTTVTNATCDSDNGAVTVNTIGGTAPFSFSLNGNEPVMDNTFTGLTPGSYTTQVMDANGCIEMETFEVEPVPIMLITVGDNKDVCEGDSVYINASGFGTIEWFLASISVGTGDSIKVSPTATSTYSAVLTDTNGCENSGQVTVTVFPSVEIVATVTDASCGQNNGFIQVEPSGGGQASYTIDGGDFNEDGMFNNLYPGTYEIEMTTNSVCVNKEYITVNDTPPISITNNISNATCGENNGSVTVLAAGGTPPFSYSIDGNEPVMDNTFTGLTPGSYTTQVMDVNGCIEMESFEIQDVIVGTLTLAGDTSICEGEISYLTAYGSGTFEWFEGATSLGTGSTIDVSPLSTTTYEVVFTDSNDCTASENISVTVSSSPTIEINNVINTGCNENTGEVHATVISPNGTYNAYWNNGAQNSDFITGLNAGDYYINVIDEDGCKGQASAVVETSGLDITGTVTDVNCNNGSDGKIEINIVGGSGNNIIKWSNGNNTTNVTGLNAGEYSVRVTDLDSGCVAYKNFVVKEPVDIFEVYFYDYSPSTCVSNDGVIKEFQPYNGNAPYQFIWSNGETGDSISDLSSGRYSVVVTDALGCEADFEVTLNNPDAPFVQGTVKAASCNESDGAINLSDLFPTPGETITGYEWSNGVTTQNNTNLAAGEYTLEVSQSNGCVGKFGYTVKHKSFDILQKYV
ncbi:MAG TPA: hypothetical protein VKX29_02115 [Brumimicrobium sp.]|nr:hypothetical protein [Brumimicrobium sp.]